jgi:hypothetical protein
MTAAISCLLFTPPLLLLLLLLCRTVSILGRSARTCWTRR